jgi:hypothetical protein
MSRSVRIPTSDGQKAFRKRVFGTRPTRELADPWTHFDFLSLFVSMTDLYYRMISTGWRPTIPSPRTRQKARSAVRKLKDTMAAGVRLERLSDTEALSRLLGQLQDEPQQRKLYARSSTGPKTILRLFAENFLLDFGFSPLTVLSYWAAMVDLPADHSTIKRAVADAKERLESRIRA